MPRDQAVRDGWFIKDGQKVGQHMFEEGKQKGMVRVLRVSPVRK